ncbi:hypothetical protein [Thermodesulfobacterium sp.]|jgi:hypothetical protein|uniref:hypothetical protein n=1 Tax=Thermodesulfobacterium sp. TaxID=1965289 RepID=UPI00257E2417|nr:hypothetical protein [Thermodesulfobacterium sp.]MBZ4682085.1 hypothetical protein [Thermodesulfobacterium sp.]MDN5380019.1 hypothetical protein [Thermodesulfobacterium sp.]
MSKGREDEVLDKLLTLLEERLKEKVERVTRTTRLPHTKGKKVKKEPKVGFYLLMSHKLYVQLKNYVEANKNETMSQIIISALEKELKERYLKFSSRVHE